MKRLVLRALAGLVVFLGMAQLAAASICPTTFNTNSDCGYILTIGAGNVVTGTAVPGANPFDGADDVLIGLINNSGAVYTGSFVLSGSGNGGGLFAFDGDGICTFITCTWAHPTTYEGPLISFSNINPAQDSGTVNVAGLAVNASTFFSLESSPASITGSGGIGIISVPEPAPLFLVSLGLVSLALLRRRAR